MSDSNFQRSMIKYNRTRYRNKARDRVIALNARRMRRTIPRGVSLRRHFFKQAFFPGAGSVTVSGAGTYTASGGLLSGPPAGVTDMAFSIFFSMSDLPQIASISAMFDEYKVNKIVYKFVPEVTSYTAAPLSAAIAVTATSQYLNTVIDYDDATVPASIPALMEYDTFKFTHPTRIHKRVFVPAISNEVYRTGGGTIGYSRKQKQWCDMAYTDIPHYGVKGYVSATATQVQQNWKIYATAYIQARSVK